MERKIGEIFTCDGKTYQIVPREKEDYCIGCAFDLGEYACKKPRNESRNNFGHCYFRFRKDKKGIIFKEINNIENNQLTIDLPEGMMVDPVNSDFRNGVIRLKYKKDITYTEICNALDYKYYVDLSVPKANRDKLTAISELMSIADYFNGDWKPDWSNQDEYKYFIIYNRNIYKVDHGWMSICSNIYFKNKKDAQAVIDNPNFRSILDAIYKNQLWKH